jgi:hypothetical protein
VNPEPLYLCLPEPLRGPSFEELLSLDELSFEELSFDALSFDEESFELLSDFGFSSFLSLSLSFDPESPPEDPGEEDFLA